MNYRHAYHAGNHADVLKHAILARVVAYLAQKDKPFAMLDAHAGLGVYDLGGSEAAKTGEWQGGIGKLASRFSSDVEVLLDPYRRVIAALNSSGETRYYPGSPEIFLQLARAQDRLIANELHAEDAATLRMNYSGDARVQVLVTDALQSVKASLPLKERRGLVLIDPPYEIVTESERVMRMLAQGINRFASGQFLIWYPVTSDEFVSAFVSAIKSLGIRNILRAELRIKKSHIDSGLSGSGMLIVNPPFGLEAELHLLLPALAERLGIEGWGRSHIEWLTPPR